MVFLGIDPGLSGAMAYLRVREEGRPAEIQLLNTPVFEIRKGSSKRHVPNEAGMAQMVWDAINMTRGERVVAALESVHAMPGQGSVSMFNFGLGFGIWRGILASTKVEYTLVTPQAWKKELMQGMSDKEAAPVRACQLFPQAAGQLAVERGKLTKEHAIGRADALLIAEHARRTHK